MLYHQLTLSNQKIDRLTSELKWASDRLGDISQSQELIAYNSEVVKKNTEIIKWISIYDHIGIK